jgi:O-antigen biosynthesis protein
MNLTPDAQHELDYYQWFVQHAPRPADLQGMGYTSTLLPYQPLISVITPTFNTPDRFLREAIESVMAQAYPYWELCLADDASTEPHVRQVLEEYAKRDDRIKVVFRSENGHISRASNSAIEIATGEFIALLDHDDLLAPEALYEMALCLNHHPELDMIYSDEDKLEENGTLRYPFFKPDWCPDSFLSRMYTCHLGLYRRSIVNTIGGFRVGFEGSQDYDLVLRFTEQTQRIHHISKILYHWRIHAQSAASGAAAKPYAYEAGKRAIASAIERRGENGVVHFVKNFPGFYIVRYDCPKSSLVSIIITVSPDNPFLETCLTSIFSSTTDIPYEVILVSGKVNDVTHNLVQNWSDRHPHRLTYQSYDGAKNDVYLRNTAANHARGNFLLFLSEKLEVTTPYWIEAMIEQSQRSTIGVTSAILLDTDRKIYHAGLLLSPTQVFVFGHQGSSKDDSGYGGHLVGINNCSAVTSDCLMCDREWFNQIGKFEESLPPLESGVDLCLKSLEQGLKNVCLPHVVFRYRVNSENPLSEQALSYFQTRWLNALKHDRCYSRHLTLETPGYSIKPSIRSSDLTQLTSAIAKKQELREKLIRVRTRLHDTQSELERTQAQLAEIETSKFWKLRNYWIRVKQFLRKLSTRD